MRGPGIDLKAVILHRMIKKVPAAAWMPDRIWGQILARSALAASGYALSRRRYFGFDFGIDNMTIVDAERTFWDKVITLQGLRRWFDNRNVLRAGGQRLVRHCYDVHQLMSDDTGAAAPANLELGLDGVAYARMFFSSRDPDLTHAEPGSFALVPTKAMIRELRCDYAAMAGMIFGAVPSLDAIFATVAALKARLNGDSA